MRCMMYCPYGWELDENNCEICSCKSPSIGESETHRGRGRRWCRECIANMNEANCVHIQKSHSVNADPRDQISKRGKCIGPEFQS